MSKTPVENLEIIERWLEETSKTNDNNVKDTSSLKIVLLQLRVLDAHLKAEVKRETGIIPIVKQIENIKDKVHDNTDDLRKIGRLELRQAFKEIKEYVLETKR